MPENDSITEEVTYSLNKSFQYSTNKGQQADAESILLTSPTAKDSRECAILRQGFLRAVREQLDGSDLAEAVTKAQEAVREAEEEREAAAKGETQDQITLPEDDPAEGGAQFLGAIAMSQSTDFGDYLDTFKKLLVGGRIAKIDGETKFKPELVSRIHYRDLENLCGVYVRNFIEGSEQ